MSAPVVFSPVSPPVPRRGPAGRQRLFAWLRRPMNILAALVFVVVIFWALFPAVFTPLDPLYADPLVRLQPPSLAHVFGTDHLGRDVFARTVYGSATSLQATLLAVAIALVLGTALGVVAGFIGGVVDNVAMRIVEIVMAIPGLLLSMSVVTALGFGTTNVAIAVGVASAAAFARLARGEVIRWRSAEFVEAARSLGVSNFGVLVKHVLPLSIGPVLALAVLELGSAVISVSTLSFLGFGQPPPQPEWGLLVAEGRDYLATSWWLTTLPGLIIVVVVLSANHLSHSLGRRRQTV